MANQPDLDAATVIAMPSLFQFPLKCLSRVLLKVSQNPEVTTSVILCGKYNRLGTFMDPFTGSAGSNVRGILGPIPIYPF